MRKRSIGLEVLDDLHDRILHYFSSNQLLNSEESLNLANDLVECIQQSWGGQLIYFPTGKGADRSARREKIIAKFNGSNHRQLAREFGLSVQAIYRILKEAPKANSDDQGE